MASWFLNGVCLNSCNSPAICACLVGGTDPPQVRCAGILAMRIDAGQYDEVDLGGLTWAIAGRWPGPICNGQGMIATYIDQRATAAQRDALSAILGGEAGSTVFEILNAVARERIAPIFVPIQFAADLTHRRGRLIIPQHLNTVIEPLTVRFTAEEHRVTVRVPGANLLREVEIARTTQMQASDPVGLDCQNTHGALGRSRLSNQALIT